MDTTILIGLSDNFAGRPVDRSLLEPLCDAITNDSDFVHLHNVTTHTFEQVLLFLNHYKADPFPHIPIPLTDPTILLIMPGWYFEFIRNNHLFDLFEAAELLHCEPLFQLCAFIIGLQFQQLLYQQ